MNDLAFKATDPYVCDHRWIASLSNGETVFMNAIPGQPSAWYRLRQYVLANKLAISQLRLQAYGHLVQCEPNQQGYWFMQRMSRYILINDSPPEVKEMGIGFLRENKIHITWVREDGIINMEIRDFKPDDLGIILRTLTPNIPFDEDDDL